MEVLNNYLDQIKIGGKQVYKNLAFFPLLSNLAIPLEYLTLDEALAGGLVEVTEKDKGGSVPELQVVNKSPQMVLILDGEELVGAKQNRIVNTTILIQGLTTIIIPVSCVEQGRWAYNNPRFDMDSERIPAVGRTSERNTMIDNSLHGSFPSQKGRELQSKNRIMSGNLRARKAEQVHYNLRSNQEYVADQREIWNQISLKADRMDAECPSMAMSEMYEKKAEKLEEYTRHFRAIEGQVGAVFLINGEVAGLDSFGKSDTFSKVFKKLIQSYALDAIDYLEPDKEIKVSKTGVSDLIQSAKSATLESRQSVGLGTDLRLETRKLTGFALALDGSLLHCSIFAKTASENRFGASSRMARFSNRSRNRG